MSATVNHHELKKRIAFIDGGPWTTKAEEAWTTIALKSSWKAIAKNSEVIDLENIFMRQKSKRQKRLRKLLRAPKKTEPIIYAEGIIRDSLDEALSRLQLYELAIECDYIPLAAVKERLRDDIVRLLWSDGARRYVQYYDFYLVAFLACRVGVDIGFPCKVPEIKSGYEVRFAAFLSQHQTWYADPLLDGWLGFLDDYQTLKSEDYEDEADKDVFYRFMTTTKKEFCEQSALLNLVAGAERFLAQLSELNLNLTAEQRPYFGSFYGYWLARFYGYDSTKKGIKRLRRFPDWSKVILGSKRLKIHRRKLFIAQSGLDDNKKMDLAMREYETLLEAANDDVRTFWKKTRNFLNSYVA